MIDRVQSASLITSNNLRENTKLIEHQSFREPRAWVSSHSYVFFDESPRDEAIYCGDKSVSDL